MLYLNVLYVFLLFINFSMYTKCSDIDDIFEKFESKHIDTSGIGSSSVLNISHTRYEKRMIRQEKYARNHGYCSVESKRLSGGTKASRNHWLFLAKFGYVSGKQDDSLECDGALIARDWILTAAHCIANLPHRRSIYVKVGSVDCLEDDEVYKTNRVFIYPGFRVLDRFGFYTHDIGMLKLEEKVTISSNVRLIKLGTGRVPIGTKCRIASWNFRNNYETREHVRIKRDPSQKYFNEVYTKNEKTTLIPDNMVEKGAGDDLDDYFEMGLERYDSKARVDYAPANRDLSQHVTFKDKEPNYVSKITTMAESTIKIVTATTKKIRRKKKKKKLHTSKVSTTTNNIAKPPLKETKRLPGSRKKPKKLTKDVLYADFDKDISEEGNKTEDNWELLSWLKYEKELAIDILNKTSNISDSYAGNTTASKLTNIMTFRNDTTEQPPSKKSLKSSGKVSNKYEIETLFENKHMIDDSIDQMPGQHFQLEKKNKHRYKVDVVELDHFETDIFEKEVIIVDPHFCTRIFEIEFMEDQIICGRSTIHGNYSNLYVGDSGGPLICNGKLYGIHSMGNYGRSKKNKSYEVYMKIDTHEEWIYKTFESRRPMDGNLSLRTGPEYGLRRNVDGEISNESVIEGQENSKARNIFLNFNIIFMFLNFFVNI